MKIHEKFYYKVQCSFLEMLLKHVSSKPLVSLWLPNFYYASMNRVVFYIIPVDDYFLTQSLYAEPYSLGVGNCTCLSEVYYFPDQMEMCHETGRMRSTPMGDFYREFEIKGVIKYVNWTLMKFFPKDIKMTASDPSGPFFIYSNLNALLGGVFPTTLDPEPEEHEPEPIIDIIGEIKETV